MVTVKIVTDSTSDLSSQVAGELGITVVPAYVRFGEKVYRDGVDISQDEFYQKLVESPVHPSISQPSPSDFADVYRKLAKETDEIVSIQVTSKLSGTYNLALQGRMLVEEVLEEESFLAFFANIEVEIFLSSVMVVVLWRQNLVAEYRVSAEDS